jgi:hypothetical protein
LLNESAQATRQTTIVLINAVGSILYGPILATFIVGILSKRIDNLPIKVGIVCGILVNLCIWIFSSISWLWWNVIGFITVLSVAYGLHWLFQPAKSTFRAVLSINDCKNQFSGKWGKVYLLILFYFLLILIVAFFIERIPKIFFT